MNHFHTTCWQKSNQNLVETEKQILKLRQHGLRSAFWKFEFLQNALQQPSNQFENLSALNTTVVNLKTSPDHLRVRSEVVKI